MLIKGLFITFEGGEGSGKSTQIDLLSNDLTHQGYPVVRTREPGGTKEAELIRDLLVSGATDKWHPKTEALLMFASRNEHWHRHIKPALDEHKIVICDRYVHSSYAYQGFGRSLDLLGLEGIYDFCIGENNIPDLVFYLDIDPEEGLKRAKKRNLEVDERFEKESLIFHQQVRKGYLSFCEKNPKTFIKIDATKDIDTIQKNIQQKLFQKIRS